MMLWILLGLNQNLTSESLDNSFENCVSLGTQFMMQTPNEMQSRARKSMSGQQLC